MTTPQEYLQLVGVEQTVTDQSETRRALIAEIEALTAQIAGLLEARAGFVKRVTMIDRGAAEAGLVELLSKDGGEELLRKALAGVGIQ